MSRNVNVLLVEDSIADSTLILEVLQEENISANVSVVRNGIQAIEYLMKHGDYANATKPDLILLDLNLPKKDGREVLAEIKKTPEIQTIPIVVLSTSHAEKDIITSYRLNASCYLTKPIDLEEFVRIVQSLDAFWFTAVKYPPTQ